MVKIPNKAWLYQVLLILVAYFLTGKLGLLLALPPGYASLVWAPMGISIAALLLLGVNRWPGVLLGAFSVNIHTTSSLLSFLIAGGISIGNTLAVVAAVLLIKKAIHFPKRPLLDREILLFLFISGPIAAIISATNGALILYLSGELSLYDFLPHWIHWYVGDAAGAMIFAPVAVLIATQSRRDWLPSIAKTLIPVCSAFVMILMISTYIRTNEYEKINSEFTRKAEITYNVLERNLNSYFEVLFSLHSFYQSSVAVTAKEFKNLAKNLHIRHPEVQALTWLTNGKVTFLEPALTNTALLDFDFNKDPFYHSLFKKTEASSEIIVSPPLNLPGDHPLKGKFSILRSVKQHDGILMLTLKLEGILKNFNTLLEDPSYRILIEDISEDQRLPLLDSKAMTVKPADEPPFKADLSWNSQIKAENRTWELSIQQDSSLVEGANLSYSVFILGSLAFLFLICSLLLIVASRIISVNEIVKEKTLHLVDLNEKLKEASEKKSAFLANMSHEIRTPLNIIIGTSDILKESPLNPEQKHYLEISQKAGHNLLNIINDILDISKIEAGLVTLENTEVNPHEIVREVYDMFALRAQEKKIELSYNLDPNTQNIYSGDPTRIRQILANLINNAIKFTQQGAIDIELRINDTEFPGNLLFKIHDTGIGIATEKISQLFQPFTQADSTITRKFGGTGLGLSISKHLIEMMKGVINVQSEVERGSCFTFTLDLPYIRPALIGNEASITNEDIIDSTSRWGGTQALNILIVDDSEDNRSLIKAYLKKSPHKIFEATNGQEAVEMAKSSNYDLILMDMQMPILDGYTATKQIRQWELQHHKTPTPIWALTAYALRDEISKSFNSGCNLHLVKPLRKNEFLQQINKMTPDKPLTL